MLLSVVASQIRNCVADYLNPTFRPTTPGFDGWMERFLAQPTHYYQGPFDRRPGYIGLAIH